MNDIKNMNIKIKKLVDNAKIPIYGSIGATGADIHALDDIKIKSGELAYIKTGIAIEIPNGFFIMMAPRGSLCLKKHLDMPHSVGIFDEDFRGEYIVPLRNLGQEDVLIEKGERIAQLILMPYMKAEFNEVSELSETERGSGAFGSTGKF